jgi:hypothetical protein
MAKINKVFLLLFVHKKKSFSWSRRRRLFFCRQVIATFAGVCGSHCFAPFFEARIWTVL